MRLTDTRGNSGLDEVLDGRCPPVLAPAQVLSKSRGVFGFIGEDRVRALLSDGGGSSQQRVCADFTECPCRTPPADSWCGFLGVEESRLPPPFPFREEAPQDELRHVVSIRPLPQLTPFCSEFLVVPAPRRYPDINQGLPDGVHGTTRGAQP